MTGDGRQNFAVRVVTDLRKVKWSSMLGFVRRILPVTFMSGGCSSAPSNLTPKLWVDVSTPSKPRRKSMCHQSRRELPVGDGLKADRLLERDGAADRRVLHRTQRRAIDLAPCRAGP